MFEGLGGDEVAFAAHVADAVGVEGEDLAPGGGAGEGGVELLEGAVFAGGGVVDAFGGQGPTGGHLGEEGEEGIAVAEAVPRGHRPADA